jgi:hypothetical protein
MDRKRVLAGIVSYALLLCVNAGQGNQTKRPREAVSLYPNRAGDQATLSAAPFCFRRYAMKPTPMKPRIIIAQVDGSGTPGVTT